MPSPLTIYLATVALVGAGLLARSLLGFSRSQRHRPIHVQERRTFEAVPTAWPFEDAREVATQHAIDEQTTAARRLVTPLIWVMSLDRDAIELWVVGWAGTPSEAWLLACEVRHSVHVCLVELGLGPRRLYLSS